jgi:hypothetical protein
MAYNVHAAEVGDKIVVEEPGRNPLEMTVWLIEPAGSAARSYHAGPRVHARIRPAGYGISFDADSYHTPHIRPA